MCPVRLNRIPAKPDRLGDFLNQSKCWTGLPTSELLGLFEGYSGASKGAEAQLEQLRAALDGDPEMTALVKSDGPRVRFLKSLARAQVQLPQR